MVTRLCFSSLGVFFQFKAGGITIKIVDKYSAIDEEPGPYKGLEGGIVSLVQNGSVMVTFLTKATSSTQKRTSAYCLKDRRTSHQKNDRPSERTVDTYVHMN